MTKGITIWGFALCVITKNATFLYFACQVCIFHFMFSIFGSVYGKPLTFFTSMIKYG